MRALSLRNVNAPIHHCKCVWLFARSAFLHHLIGWTLVVASVFPLGEALRPRRAVWAYGFAATWVLLAVMLFADRDVAPIFGHLSELAGGRP